MEKNRFLVTSYKTLSIIIILLFLSTCSLPRIAVLRDPLAPEEHIKLGLIYEKRGEFDAALSEYQAASGKLPIACLYMGNIYFQKGCFEKAESLYGEAIKETQNPHAFNNLAWLYYTINRNLEDAVSLAKKALEIEPENPDFKDTLNKIVERRKSQPAP